MSYVCSQLATHNEALYNEDKVLEELAELAEVILKARTKRNTEGPSQQDLIDEIGDVQLRLEVYKKMLGIEREVDIRIGKKLNKFADHLNTKRYKNI